MITEDLGKDLAGWFIFGLRGIMWGLWGRRIPFPNASSLTYLAQQYLLISVSLSPSHSFLPFAHTHATWHLILEPKHGKQEAELLSVGNYSQKWHSVTSAGFIPLVQAVKAQPGSKG